MNDLSKDKGENPIVKNSPLSSGLILLIFLCFVSANFTMQHQSETYQRVIITFFRALDRITFIMVSFNIFQMFLFRSLVRMKTNERNSLDEWIQELSERLSSFPNYGRMDFIFFLSIALAGLFIFPPLLLDGIFALLSSIGINRAKLEYHFLTK